ncbi:MAG: outer membrane protein assembly factor BamA [Methylocystis sp.]|nr:outer membrane protein assembly factor BamA [Methylocystis sp.]
MQSIGSFWKRASLMMAVLVVAVGYSAFAFAQAIDVVGNTRGDSDMIRSYFTGTGAAEVEQGVAALRNTGRFTSVSATREQGRVVVHVAESNLINRVAFEGNSKIKTENLQSEVKTHAHGSFSPSTADADVARLTEIYRRSGRAAAKISYRTVDLPNGRIDVVFTVDEGEKTGVKEIKFVGNQVYSTGRLVGLMETTEMNLLSFLKNSDVYDPDRIAADLELVRRYYLKNGYADFHIVSSDATFDPARGGYILTIVIEEGPQYRVSSVDVESRLADIDPASLRPLVRLSEGDVYNGDAVEKTVETLTREIAKKGYAFSQARPRGERNAAARTVAIRFVVEEGPRVYIERINVHGNARTRDYVIRREFEVGEGDAYNRVLIDRAERRLNGLGYFKKVRITNEPGSAPDRVVINVDVEDQPTGNFGVSGGWSTNEGFLGEVSVSESNLMGRGQAARLSVQEGERARGVTFSFTEPYFLDQRVAAGFDVFAKRSDAFNFSVYNTTSIGGTLRAGVPITEEISFSPHYSIYNTTISIPNDSKRPFNDCQLPVPGTTPGFSAFFPPPAFPNLAVNCLTNGEASLAIKESQGSRLTSLIGYSTAYSTLDNFRNPKNGFHVTTSEEVAGLGGDSRFIRSSGDLRYFHELPVLDDVVGIAHLQGGNMFGIAGYQLRVVDNFNLGPSLVRGFAPGGIGPRDNSDPLSTRGNSLGGTDYVGASLEAQFPIWGVPKDIGLRGAVFADAGTLWGYKGATNFSKFLFGVPNLPCVSSTVIPAAPGVPFLTQGSCITLAGDTTKIRTSIGASILWQSPLGPLRFDFAFPLSKATGDITQVVKMSGGANF